MSEYFDRVVHADFRRDPLIVSLLRRAIAKVGFALPDFDEKTFLHLMSKYREAKGERGFDIKFSAAKQELDAHRAAFKTQYATVLGSCLYSQLDRMQGREPMWAYLDSDSVGLVSDAVIERRLVIDELTRLVDSEADEGVKVFDALLCKALGRQSTSIRENPMRPAVYFHALGVCWTRASGSSSEELFVLRNFGPAIAERVNTVFPELTGMLREGLGIKKPSGNLLAMRTTADGSSPYARRPSPSVNTPQGDPAAQTRPSASVASNPSSTDRGSVEEAFKLAQLRLEKLEQIFDAGLNGVPAPTQVQMLIAQMQLPLARCVISDPDFFENEQHPIRRLLNDLFNPVGWQRLSGADALEAVIAQLELTVAMVRRERPGKAMNLKIYDHLRSQLLAVRSAQPAPITPAEPATKSLEPAN